MVIGVDARELCDNPAGKGQYLDRVLHTWLLEQTEVNLALYIKSRQDLPAFYVDNSRVKIIKEAGRGFLWHYRVGSRLRRDGVSVFFAALSYQSAIFNCGVPTVTVVHDLAVFKLKNFVHNKKAQLVERLTLRLCVSKSKGLVAVSESTKNDLIIEAPLSKKKIKVVGEAALLMGGDLEYLNYSQRKSFFLFVGTLEPRKNIANILEAYSMLPPEIRDRYSLKLAGKEGWGGQNYSEIARELKLEKQVQFLGYVSNTELASLYREANLFIYPSWYEGFGLPVIEALSAGTPVVCSNTSSLPYVVGEGGICCDPGNAKEISEAIEKLLDQKNFEYFSEKALLQAKKFDWSSISYELFKYCESFCSK